MTIWSSRYLEGFHEAAQSLKLHRGGELADDKGKPLIEMLYVDPLPENHLFKTLLKPHTTFIIGRRGTGKTTILERVRVELFNNATATGVLINIKAVHNVASREFNAMMEKEPNVHLSPQNLKTFLFCRAFLRILISELKTTLEEKATRSFMTRMTERLKGSFSEIVSVLDMHLECTLDANPLKSREHIEIEESGGEVQGHQQKPPKGGFSKSSVMNMESADAMAFLEDMMASIKELLNSVSIRSLYVLIDDFSELNEEAMQMAVSGLLSPLNNWQQELIKLKVAACPGRMSLDGIDKTKIDEIHLDPLKAYGNCDVTAMEDKSIDFIKRLVEKRIEHFCGVDPSFFFESTKEDIWRTLFYASMGNARILGHILCYAYESRLLSDGKIGSKTIRDAALRYYEEKIESCFTMKTFFFESFHERSSLYSLKVLLDCLINRAKELGTNRTSLQLPGIKDNPPTSHFHVNSTYDAILDSLESNYFISKYGESKNGERDKMSIYALNYGLCQKHSLEFGRPVGKKEYRSYFMNEVFDYSSIIKSYIKTNQEISCTQCGEKFDIEKLHTLKLYNMQCPKCLIGKCTIVNLSKKYATLFSALENEMILPHMMLPTAVDPFLEVFLYSRDPSQPETETAGKKVITSGNVEVNRRIYPIRSETDQGSACAQ